MIVNNVWATLIAAFLTSQTAAGYPSTTVHARRQHLEHLARRVGVDPTEVTGEHLLEYAAAQSWANETRRSRRQTFRLFWDWAVRNEHVQVNAAAALPRVKPSPPSPRPCPDGPYLRALIKANRRERVMLRLAAEMGLRRAEVTVVNKTDLVEDLGGVTLEVHGKGGKTRNVPLPAGLALELVELSRENADGYAFPGAVDGHLSARWVGKLIGRLLPEGLGMHTLRHRFSSRAYANGVDIFVLQDILGHASPATTRRYVPVPRIKAREAIDLLQTVA